MRRLAQFVRLRASRVSRLHLSASACVCICLRLRLSRVSRLASVSRLSRVCICLRASVSRLSVCICLASASASVSRLCASVSRLCASVSRQGFRMRASVCVGRLVSRLSVLVNACGNWLILCIGRHSKSLKGFCYRHTIL